MRNLQSQRFGGLIAMCQTNKRSGAHIIWLCRCDCGNLIYVRSNNLVQGRTKSCGCFNTKRRKERMSDNRFHLKHGDAIKDVRYYRIWKGINTRCFNPNDPSYKWYGRKGITVCDKWKTYQNFRDWALANGYADNLTIDRIDNDGNYEPSNCQWITNSENIKKSWKERSSK